MMGRKLHIYESSTSGGARLSVLHADVLVCVTHFVSYTRSSCVRINVSRTHLVLIMMISHFVVSFSGHTTKDTGTGVSTLFV